MIRELIVIDEEKCNGCGLCVSACHDQPLSLKIRKQNLYVMIIVTGWEIVCLPVLRMQSALLKEKHCPIMEEINITKNPASNLI